MTLALLNDGLIGFTKLNIKVCKGLEQQVFVKKVLKLIGPTGFVYQLVFAIALNNH